MYSKGIEIFQQGGFVMIPLLILSLVAVAFAVERLLAFRQYGGTAPGLVDEVVELIGKGRADQAQARAEEATGPVAATIATALRNRTLDVEDIEREVAVTEEDYFVRLERYLPWIDTFTTLSPLLGLLGTILGMVKVFDQFTNESQDETAKGEILAGVGESLYATAFGITIALFCFFFYNYFASRQRAISIEVQQGVSRVLAALSVARVQRAGGVIAPTVDAPRHAKRRGRREVKKTKIEIIPMIDTMFFLLVFFILSSLGVIQLPDAVPVKLPSAVQSDVRQPGRITLSIDPTGRAQINSQRPVAANADLVAPLLREARKQGGVRDRDIANILLVINADKSVDSGVVVRAMNAAAVVGIGKVSIATEQGAAQ
jgi:biopolymer transport protein ExbB